MLEIRRLTQHFQLYVFLGLTTPREALYVVKVWRIGGHYRQAVPSESKWGTALWRQDAVNFQQPMTFDQMSKKAMCHPWEGTTSSIPRAHR